ncbi:hypothetical protein DAA51_24730 [Bradyrhizobium sp. WBAH10]|nr:hypothetical protein [Bradyrhizobium sp. WBAH30]MDD1547190.1 hypothetical protein [Bradyrhizobium sp. WBAH41]MDD1560761.1 hypothetical protein [Bradyrhizobium sp. WBAH23]MDD1568235.1 hypothetical protein [Bradyrhizobium sp. WBAH33]MDD1594122.1 hypothetical protein [Bradyrhizobium sp. WBAH42]NRB91782.1 hypothetical protein [Bradyrhizobium sp. WBAH10]QCJ91281.1 hypothetical protein DAA57_24320 [Bradyrhizobium yuanmingense]
MTDRAVVKGYMLPQKQRKPVYRIDRTIDEQLIERSHERVELCSAILKHPPLSTFLKQRAAT